jgi:hypothetical protein
MGGGTFRAFRFRGNNMPCNGLVINTQLSSPDEDVLRMITVGDELRIGLVDSYILAAFYENDVVGVIVNKEILNIMMCMEQGFKFRARVRNLVGGRCSITIRCVNKDK